ncbi:hypothetical protein [Tenacibaculum litopenaei]
MKMKLTSMNKLNTDDLPVILGGTCRDSKKKDQPSKVRDCNSDFKKLHK